MLPLRRAKPITTKPSFILHLAKNVGFLLTSFVFLPLSFFITLLALLKNALRSTRRIGPPYSQRMTIMVSGVRATKGLTLAREFARAGHRVIAVEESSQWFASARFSSYIAAFHLLPDPLVSQDDYTKALVQIAKDEGVQLYVPACGVATTICDGVARPELEATGVRVIQFRADLGRKLDKKDLFMEMCIAAGLRVPVTQLVRSVDDVMRFDFEGKGKGKRFLMKCVGVDDRTRNNMTLFPLADPHKMRSILEELQISVANPYILQEFVQGTEYLTQSLVSHGNVLTYTCCESSDLLVNYVSLPPSEHVVAAAGLAFTRTFAEKYNLTGQIAFDFIRSDVDHEIYAIECNPRTHTAIVLYRKFPAHPSSASQSEWVRAYTHGTVSPSAADAALARNGGEPLVPEPAQGPAYWIGHELFDAARFLDWRTLLHRFLYEVEGHWDEQDPLPWFSLYHVQWPMVFGLSLFTGRRWTRVNASTGKVFWC